MAGHVPGKAAFEALRKPDIRVRRGPIVVAFVGAPRVELDGEPRRFFAFSIGRKVGRAVRRNKVRRRLRAIVSSPAHRGLPDGLYLISAGPETASISFGELEGLVNDALAKVAKKI